MNCKNCRHQIIVLDGIPKHHSIDDYRSYSGKLCMAENCACLKPEAEN